MNSFEVNRYPSRNFSIESQYIYFPNSSKKTASFPASKIHKNTEVCMLTVTESISMQGQIVVLWYTFDGTVPDSTNGHRMTSKDILHLSPGAIRVARFSHEPNQNVGAFRLRMEQLSV